jgi:hypothetical protein
MKKCIMLLLFLLLLASPANSSQVRLAWDPHPMEHHLSTFRVYYSETPGSYTLYRETGVVYEFEFFDLEEGKTYYFVATAVGVCGQESPYSNEVHRFVGHAEPDPVDDDPAGDPPHPGQGRGNQKEEKDPGGDDKVRGPKKK